MAAGAGADIVVTGMSLSLVLIAADSWNQTQHITIFWKLEVGCKSHSLLLMLNLNVEGCLDDSGTSGGRGVCENAILLDPDNKSIH